MKKGEDSDFLELCSKIEEEIIESTSNALMEEKLTFKEAKQNLVLAG